MLNIDYKNIGWWYWLAATILLTLGILGNGLGFILAIGVTAIHLLHYVIRHKSIKVFPVQVRFWYLMLLFVALPTPMQWLYWLPCIGTWVQAIFGYCLMARMVSILPWNREDTFSLKLLIKTFLSLPVKGSIQQNAEVNK